MHLRDDDGQAHAPQVGRDELGRAVRRVRDVARVGDRLVAAVVALPRHGVGAGEVGRDHQRGQVVVGALGALPPVDEEAQHVLRSWHDIAHRPARHHPQARRGGLARQWQRDPEHGRVDDHPAALRQSRRDRVVQHGQQVAARTGIDPGPGVPGHPRPAGTVREDSRQPGVAVVPSIRSGSGTRCRGTMTASVSCSPMGAILLRGASRFLRHRTVKTVALAVSAGHADRAMVGREA